MEGAAHRGLVATVTCFRGLVRLVGGSKQAEAVVLTANRADAGVDRRGTACRGRWGFEYALTDWDRASLPDGEVCTACAVLGHWTGRAATDGRFRLEPSERLHGLNGRVGGLACSYRVVLSWPLTLMDNMAVCDECVGGG